MDDQNIQDYHVPETTFGKWFLRSQTWKNHVLERALKDLERLIPAKRECYPVILDVGSGYGRSLVKLNQRFKPERLIGMDVDPEMVNAGRLETEKHQVSAEFLCCSCAKIELEDSSVDLLFCHQTFHHVVDQERAIKEFYRVLKPGGLLLFAESTRRYIHSWLIRYLFRHPMEIQKTAGEYMGLIKGAGFAVSDHSVSYPFLWWSREDLGIAENWFKRQPPKEREETLVNLVAEKPE